MNILHLDSGREMRGGQWQALLLMQALARRGHRQELLARPGSPLLERARRAGFAAGPLRAGRRLPTAGAMQPDIIHAHDAGAHTWAALRSLFARGASRRCWGAPLVVARRVAFPIGRGWFSRWKYSRAARYIAVSRYVARELTLAGVPEERITVVFDGVSLPDLSRAAELRAEFRRRWNLPPDAFVAGTLTTLREKPILPLLEAAERRARLHLLVASADAAQRAQRGPANIHFLRPEEDISPFLFALDAFVHLSDSEGLGSAALLAMAHGLPVVASDVGGLPEIVRDGDTGLLVRNLTLEVGAALEKLFAGRAQAAEMGRRARRFVEAAATDDIMAERTEPVYREAVGNTVGSRD